MGKKPSWQPSELGQAARLENGGAPPNQYRHPQHAVTPLRSQGFWLAVGFMLSLVVALGFAAGILWWKHAFTDPAVRADSPRTHSTRMAAGDSIGTDSELLGAAGQETPTPSSPTPHETETNQACGINGTTGAAIPCPTTPATLAGNADATRAGAGQSEVGQTGAGQGDAEQTGAAQVNSIKGCDGATIVAPATGKLSALQLRQKFEAIGAQAGAKIAVAWYDPRYGLVTAGEEGAWPAWSTSKVPLAVAVTQAGHGGNLKYGIQQAITVSDNESADRLWQSLGSNNTLRAEAVTKVIRQSGDLKTVVPTEKRVEQFSIFGQTQWIPLNQVRFAAALPCLKETAPVIENMRHITASQRWGMGQLPGAVFKGGWGPSGGGYTVRQFGWYQDRDGNRVFLALATQAGSMGAGTAVLDSLAGVLR